MAIDTSMYSRGNQVFSNIGDNSAVQEGMNMRSMIDQRQARQAQQSEDLAVKQAFQNNMVKNPDGSIGINQPRALGQIAQVNPMKAMELQQSMQQQDAATAKARMEKQMHTVNMTGQILGGVGDQASWTRALQDAPKYGIDVSQMPQSYDPNFVKSLQMRTLTAKDQLDNQFKTQDMGFKQTHSDLEQKKFGLDQQKFVADKKKDAGATDGRKAVDKDYAKDYNDWTTGGQATLDKNLDRLKSAREALKSDPSLTGSVRGMAPDWLRNVTNEKAITTRDDVRSAAQGALKAALGASFTEKEGERIMNAAYNEKLSPEANIAKLDAAIQEIETTKANQSRKAQYFQQRGTLSGLDATGEPSKIAAGSKPSWAK